MRITTFILACILIFQTRAQVEEGRRITSELCSPSYFGRGYIKQGDSLAAEFLAAEFKNKGLKPASRKGYFQDFYFDVNTFPGEVLVEMNGRKLRPGVDFLLDPSSGPSDLPWKYRFLDKSNLFQETELAEMIREIRSARSWNSLVIDLRGITGDSLKQAQAFKRQMALICHVMVIHDQKFTFSVDGEQLPFTLLEVKGSVFENGSKITTRIDAVWKKNHHARNVMAVIPAKRKSKEYIVLTAHYDHLGGMGAETYFPGGNDNASGTSMLFALADQIQKKRLKYNVLFIAFAGEEAGLIGSKHYTEHPVIKLDKIHFLLNLDIMGSGEEGITVVNGAVLEQPFELLRKINSEKQLLAQVKKRGKAANSDHYWFSEKGVPAFFIYTMGPNKNYHDVFDTYEALSFSEYNDLVQLILTFCQKL